MMSAEKRMLMVWNRLPAFRAVASTQHLPTAAKQLFVTAPALSRAIRLLEEELGQKLFERSGRRLVLNQAGEELLERLSDTMSQLEGTIRDIGKDPMIGAVRISSAGMLSDQLVVPAVLALTTEHENFEPHLEVHHSARANELIARGRLDLAIYHEPMSDERLEIVQLGEVRAGIYCGRSHPLFEQEKVDDDDLTLHAFCVPHSGDTGQALDGWPVGRERHIGMRVTMVTSNLQVCLSGQFLAVLPDAVAQSHVAQGTLRRLPSGFISPIPIYAANRPNVGALCPSCIIKHAVKDVIDGNAAG
jgi:DNA-binding transcriptional LysR family regulator